MNRKPFPRPVSGPGILAAPKCEKGGVGGEWGMFGVRALMEALCLPTGRAVRDIVIHARHGEWARVYVGEHVGGRPDALLELVRESITGGHVQVLAVEGELDQGGACGRDLGCAGETSLSIRRGTLTLHVDAPLLLAALEAADRESDYDALVLARAELRDLVLREAVRLIDGLAVHPGR